MLLVTNILLIAIGLPVLGFIYFYARYSPWRSTLQGKTLMSTWVGLFVLILYYLISGGVDYPAEGIVKIIILFGLMVLFWTVFVALRMAQTEQTPVPKKRGTGYRIPADLEKTNPRYKETK